MVFDLLMEISLLKKTLTTDHVGQVGAAWTLPHRNSVLVAEGVCIGGSEEETEAENQACRGKSAHDYSMIIHGVF